MLTLNDLLKAEHVEVNTALVFRHRPYEPQLNRVLPRLAQEKPEIFNTYQQFQGERLEAAMRRAKHVVSFVGRQTGEALSSASSRSTGGKPSLVRNSGRSQAISNLKNMA